MAFALRIPKQITHGEELVILRRQEYERLRRRLIEVKDALAKIRKGEKELKEGKTRLVNSLSELRRS